MNIGDKTRSVTIRFSPEQWEFLKRSADDVDLTVSKYLRVMVSGVMALDKLSDKSLGAIADSAVGGMLSETMKKD